MVFKPRSAIIKPLSKMIKQTKENRLINVTDKPILNSELLKAISGLRVAISNYTIEQEKRFCDSPLNNVLSIGLKNSEVVKCYCCDRNNINWCWNCEKPHCDKHAKAVFCGCMINTLCLDCSDRLIKYAGEKHALLNHS